MPLLRSCITVFSINTCMLFFFSPACFGQKKVLTPQQMQAYGDSVIRSIKMMDSISKMPGKNTTIFLPDSTSNELIKDYNKFALKQYQRAYSWQFYSSIFIFVLVIAVVIMGLYMAYRQFLFAQQIIVKELSKVPNQDNPSRTIDLNIINADLEVSNKGLKINTAVIGLVILTLSLGFFFMYLKYVYQIVLIKPL